MRLPRLFRPEPLFSDFAAPALLGVLPPGGVRTRAPVALVDFAWCWDSSAVSLAGRSAPGNRAGTRSTGTPRACSTSFATR